MVMDERPGNGAGAGQRKSESVKPPGTIYARRLSVGRGLVSGFAMLCLAGLVNSGSAFAAGGPYVVDDYEIPAAGTCQIESWASFGKKSDRIFVMAPSCTFESLSWLEVGFAVERSRSSGDWATTTAPVTKASIIPIDQFGVGMAVAGSVEYDWTERAISGATAAALFTFKPVERTLLNLNLGYERDQIERRDYAIWGVGATLEPVENLAFIAEVFGRHEGRAGIQAGVRPTLFDGRLDVDFVVGRNLSDTRAIWFTVGTALRF